MTDEQIEPPSVSCAHCGARRPAELSRTTDRAPCDECGGTAINVAIVIHETIGPIVDTVSATLRPADQVRDWKRRWAEIQRAHTRLITPREGEMSSDALHAAQHELQAFYIQAYHLKDALKAEAAATGILAQDVENAISSQPELVLLADLANLEKHVVLTKTRSGAAPKVVETSATSETGSGGWTPNIEIEHNGTRLDGIAAATAAVVAWRKTLLDWGLIKP
jgi:hypothetical protein